MAHSKDKRGLTPSHCEIPGCDFDFCFQRHRIKPGNDGGKYRVGNVVALCPNHHAFADAGALTRQQLWDIVRDRLFTWLQDETITAEVYENSVDYIDRHYYEEVPVSDGEE